MALIGARVMGIELAPGTVRKFQPVELANESYMVDVEIICPGFGLPCACIYRKADGTWGWEQPCGSGPP
jgi:hypothetical protein